MNFVFDLFFALAFLSGVMVIRARNPVHSVLFLILVFFNAAALLLLLGLDFFALILLVVYVGAIAVLFLFVVMMLNIKLTEIDEKKLRYLPIGGLVSFVFLFETSLIVDTDLIPFFHHINLHSETFFHDSFLKCNQTSHEVIGFQNTSYFETPLENTFKGGGEMLYKTFSFVPAPHLCWDYLRREPLTNIETVGNILYTYYCFFFLIASLILLVAMIGAIVLTMRKGGFVKRQQVFLQNTREYGKTVVKTNFQIQ